MMNHRIMIIIKNIVMIYIYSLSNDLKSNYFLSKIISIQYQTIISNMRESWNDFYEIIKCRL